MPGEPGRAPPPTAVEVWPSVAPFGEAGRISVSIIVLAFLCSSAGSTFASPGGKNHTWPPTAQTTGLDQVSDSGIAARSSEPDIRCGRTSRGRAVPASVRYLRQQPAARCVAPSKCCPGTAVGRHRICPTGAHQVMALAFTESERPPRPTSIRGRADHQLGVRFLTCGRYDQ